MIYGHTDIEAWRREQLNATYDETQEKEQVTQSEPTPASRYGFGDVECIDALRSCLTEEEFRGYCKGNIIKYVWRERHKQGDGALRKARDYISQLLDGQWSEQ